MQSFVQYTPTEIVFGRDAEGQTGKEVRKWGGSHVLLVYGGGSVIKSGLLERIKTVLSENEILYEEIGGVKPNPRLSLVEEGVRKGLAAGVDMVVAVGGGSAIDSAKAMAHGIANPDSNLWDIWTGKVPLEKSIPVGVILTIAAAGSEMSNSAVITNEKLGRKQGISTDLNRPKFAIMNPELTYTLPKYQLACGIADIMMHTLERYFTQIEGNQLTDEIAEGLLRTVIENGAQAFENQMDYDSMSELMWCSSISHNGLTGLGRKKVFPVHKMGHELGAKYDVAHGASLTAVWEAWALYSYEAGVERFARFGRKVWGIEGKGDQETALEAIGRMAEFFKMLKLPVSIGELECGVLPDKVLEEMAAGAMGSTDIMSQFKEYRTDDIYEIYKKANH